MLDRALLIATFCLCILSIFTSGASTGKQVFTKSNFNEFKSDAPVDVARSFPKTHSHGCTGLIRNGELCTSEKKNRGLSKEDPENGSNKVLGIRHKAHTAGSGGGSQFYQSFEGLNDKATLEYEVYFPSDFEWKKGGKLPGLHGGNEKCSGGFKADGKNCYSLRLMWRENGAFETYAYLPLSKAVDEFCAGCAGYAEPIKKCSQATEHHWCAIDRKSKNKFKKNKWHKIQQSIKLNDPDEADGTYELRVDGELISKLKNVVYRTTDKLKVNGLFFSTFFGGDDSSYAPSSDQMNYFKNFKLYT
eukprot:Awhi_evm1s5432